MTIMNKIADIDTLAVEKTKRLLTIDQMARLEKWFMKRNILISMLLI